MVTLTQEAAARIENVIASSLESLDWFLLIEWKKGEADNRRSPDGEVAWERHPDEGWVATLGGYEPGRVPRDVGTPLHHGVRLLIREQPPAPEVFPGGEVYVEGGEFKVRTHAI